MINSKYGLTRTKRLISWLMGRRPVFRVTMWKCLSKALCDYNSYILDTQARHAAELRETSKMAVEVVAKCSEIQFRKGRDQKYVVAITFNTRLLSDGTEGLKEKCEYIARLLGNQVEDEISSLRFVQSAKDLEAEELRPANPPFPQKWD